MTGAWLLISVSGCASQSGLVAKMFEQRTGCTSVEVRWIGKGRHHAEGCGVTRDYECRSDIDTLLCEELVSEREREQMAIDLVARAHRSRHSCAGVSVAPLGNSIYEARGCGPEQRYRCVAEGQRVFCEAALSAPVTAP